MAFADQCLHSLKSFSISPVCSLLSNVAGVGKMLGVHKARTADSKSSEEYDLTYNIVISSKTRGWGVCLFLDDHYSKTALFVAGLAFPFAPASPLPPPFLCLLNCIYLNSGFFFFLFAFALIAQERGVS